MSKTTLARRIRRIGLLPTTHKIVEEQRLYEDENGKEVSLTVGISKPVRNHQKLDLVTLKQMREALICEARAACKLKKVLR